MDVTSSTPRLDRAFELLESLRSRLHAAGQTRLAAYDDLLHDLDRYRALPTAKQDRTALLLSPLIPSLELLVDAETARLASRSSQVDVGSIVRRVTRTLEAVDGNIVISSETSLDVRYARVDAAALAHEVAKAFQSVNQERNVAVTVTTPSSLIVEVDPFKLEVIVLSLVFNGTKHASEGGWIHLSIDLEEDGDFFAVRVADDGPQIDPVDATAIFERSGEIERGTLTWVGEVPLGLLAAQDLATLHGGLVKTEALVTRSASILARLPVRAPRGTTISPEAPPRSDGLAKEAARIAARELAEERRLASRPVERGGRPLVLIVDHSRTVQRILVEHLEPEYAVICAFSGQEALSLAVREKPNLVILDVVLPDMDGDDVVSQLRQCPDMEDAPILVLTSSRDEDKLLELLAGSVQDVVKKPFMTVAVGARVRNLLAERRTRELLNATIGRHETDLVVLAERVVGQQEALKIAREAADAANRAKSDFLRMMSHELRTPITAMELQMKLIELDRDSVPEKVHVGLRRIARSSRRLNRIIDTVMAWARVESGRLELDVSPLRAADLVERAATDLRELAELKGIGITTRVEEDVTIESDRGMAYLLVANLLAHAVQVTSHGTVCATVGGRPAATRIVVRDDGPRLPDGAEADILRPFEAVEPLHRRSGFGSGLDLHVVWDIARALSGDVSLMRDEERGNAFVLTLPSLRKAGTAV